MKEKTEASLIEGIQNLKMGIENLTGLSEENLLLKVLEVTTIPFLVTLPSSGSILYANQAFRELFGYSQDDLHSLKAEHLYFRTDDRKRLLDALYAKRELSWLEVEGRTKTDEQLSLRLTLTLTHYEQQDAVIVAFEDITRRLQLEKALSTTETLYRSLVDVMQDGVIMRLADGSISMANKAAERIYGIPLERITKHNGKPEFDVVDEHGNSLPSYQYPTFLALKTGQVQKNKVFGIKSHNGKWIWIKMNVVPLFHANHTKPYACVASFSDISRQKETEQQLRELNKTKDTLFRVIGHDLRSQITAIMGISDLIELEVDDIERPTLHHYLQLLKTAAAGNFSLLQNLTDWSHNQLVDSSLHVHRFHLYDKVNEVLELFVPIVKQKKIVVEVSIPEHVQVDADADVFTAILRNLISNALKYSLPLGHVRIDSAYRDDAFSVTVQDTGIGMTQQQLEDIWSDKPVTPRPGTQQEKGAGIGLRLVKDLVEKHNGYIQLDSAKGLGSAFTVTLPELSNR